MLLGLSFMPVWLLVSFIITLVALALFTIVTRGKRKE
jgi:hypothetical protein